MHLDYGTHSFPGFGLGAWWDVGSDMQGDVEGARPRGFHPRWVGNPDQASDEEKRRCKVTSEHLIKFFRKSKLPRARLCRHKLYLF